MFFTKQLTDFREKMYSKWAHELYYRQHLDHMFQIIGKHNDYMTIEFEIYYTTNYKHNIQYVKELLNIKYYL